jgi:thiamine-monophosphate kinase
MTDSPASIRANLGEFGLIARIASCATSRPDVITGIGDDAAVMTISAGMHLLASTDMLLENVHFRRSWHDPFRLGRKSLAVNISDIAAMGGIPRWALLSLAIPPDLPVHFVDSFIRGFLEMATEYNVSLVGGDTCASRTGFTVSVTIMGEQSPDRIVRRSGAMADDDIWVTGTLGDAALALRIVEKEGDDKCVPVNSAISTESPRIEVGQDDPLIVRLLDPNPRVTAALALAEAGLATAMIDISDGILADYGHIAKRSSVGGRIFIDDLPLSADFHMQTASLSDIPYELALSGGEDYELCFTANRCNREKVIASMKKCGIAVTRVGIVTNVQDVTAVSPDGSRFNSHVSGYKHLF